MPEKESTETKQAEAKQQEHAKQGPAEQGPAKQNSVSAEDIAKAIVAAKAVEDAKYRGPMKTEGMDKSLPGGRYIVGGKIVDAFGKPVT